MTLRDKMLAVMQDVNSQVAEREDLVELIAIALLTRNNLFILGKPGQAKSLSINLFRQRITGARQFERLLSKQTDEDQLFGRIDLSSLIPGSVPDAVLQNDDVHKNLRRDLQCMVDGLGARKDALDTFAMLEKATDQVLSLLQSYRATKRKIEQLRYELEHPIRVTPDEMIEAMNFAKGDGEGRPSGSVSNKTLYIAMNFQSAADEANAALTHDLVSRLVPLEQEINRLEHYVALLEPRQTEVIRRTFFDSQSLPEICKEMGYSTKTVRAIRNHAIEELAAMYEFAAGVI